MRHPLTGRGHARRTALTLVELLVTLALAAVLVTSVVALLRCTRAVVGEATARHRSTMAQDLVFELLTQDLHALASTGSVALADDALTMTTTNAMHGGAGARHAVEVHYRLATARGDQRKMLRLENEVGAEPEHHHAVTVASALVAATFTVFDGRTWQRKWPPTTPQQAFAVRLELTSSPARSWSRTVVIAPLPWEAHHD